MSSPQLKAILLALFLSAASLGADEGSASSTRLEELEQKTMDLESTLSLSKPVERSQADSLYLGGYFTLQGGFIPDYTSHASVTNLDFNLMPRIQFSPYWRGLAEARISVLSALENPHTASRKWGKLTQQTELERAWVEYTGLGTINLIFGYFYTPYGVLNQEHESTIRKATDLPLYLQSGIVPSNVAGIGANGKLTSNLLFNLYGGSASDDRTEVFDTLPIIAGARLTYILSLWGKDIVVGFNYQHSVRRGLDPHEAFGADLETPWERFKLLLESVFDNQNHVGLYLQPSYALGEYRLYYALDYIDTRGHFAEDRYRHILGVNYRIASHMVIKGEFQRVIYEIPFDANGHSKDYSELVGQIAFSF